MPAKPRHHTPRNPARATLGGLAAKTWAATGRPFMPWQRAGADVALELDPVTGLLWYDLVIVRVQRQAGKTELVGSVATTRALAKRNARLWYTAQKGKDASEWMRDEYISRLADAQALFGVPKSASCRYLASLRAGQEAVKWKASRSKFQAIPPTKDAMHGKQSDMTIVDEAWYFDAVAGAALRQAIRPTMNTRKGSQLWIVSAGEALDSAYFAEYIELGLLSLNDPDSRVCFIDYGIPEGGDPEDLDLVAASHPAVGYTIDRRALEAARLDFSNDPAGWARAYATVTTGAREFAFPPAAWTECGSPAVDPLGAVQLAVDVTPDGSRLAIGGAYTVDGNLDVELIYAGDRDGSALGLLSRLATAHRGPIHYDPQNHAALALDDDLARLHPNTETQAVAAANVAAACGTMTRHVLSRTLRHHHQPDLDDAAKVAVKRPAGDGGVRWSRSRSQGSIAELYAVALAGRAALATPAKRRPVARAGTRR